jgi:hypothetical protein
MNKQCVCLRYCSLILVHIITSCVFTPMHTHTHAFSHACLPRHMGYHAHVFSDHLFLLYAFSHACVFTHICLCIIARMKFKLAFLHACICWCTCITIHIARTIEKTQHDMHQHRCSPHNCCHDAHLPRYVP